MIELRELKYEDELLLVEYLNDERVIACLLSRIPFPYSAIDAEWWVTIGNKEDGIVRAIECNGIFCIG